MMDSRICRGRHVPVSALALILGSGGADALWLWPPQAEQASVLLASVVLVLTAVLGFIWLRGGRARRRWLAGLDNYAAREMARAAEPDSLPGGMSAFHSLRWLARSPSLWRDGSSAHAETASAGRSRRPTLNQGGAFMLVLSRKPGERILLPSCEVVLTVLEVQGRRVRLGISAPAGVDVYREEVRYPHRPETRRPAAKG
jgi:carbon storage regulator